MNYNNKRIIALEQNLRIFKTIPFNSLPEFIQIESFFVIIHWWFRNKCNEFDETCATCFVITSSKCYENKEGYFESSGTCSKCDPSCPTHQYLKDSSCHEYSDSCAECKEYDNYCTEWTNQFA